MYSSCMEDRNCKLSDCPNPVTGAANKQFCSRKCAQKFHNSLREYDPEKDRAAQRARRAADPEAARERARKYYLKNREKMSARQAAYYHANKERCQAINRRVHERNPFHA